MNTKTLLSSLLISVTYIYHSQAYRILVIAHTSARSHYIAGSGIAKALVKAEHDVTIVAPFKSSEPIENFNEIFLDGRLALLAKDNTKKILLIVSKAEINSYNFSQFMF